MEQLSLSFIVNTNHNYAIVSVCYNVCAQSTHINRSQVHVMADYSSQYSTIGNLVEDVYTKWRTLLLLLQVVVIALVQERRGEQY